MCLVYKCDVIIIPKCTVWAREGNERVTVTLDKKESEQCWPFLLSGMFRGVAENNGNLAVLFSSVIPSLCTLLDNFFINDSTTGQPSAPCCFNSCVC